MSKESQMSHDSSSSLNILCSFPGRHGDILWALPTVRAISEHYGCPVDLAISGKYGSLKDLLERQEYMRQVLVVKEWIVEETAPMTPRMPPSVLGVVNGDLVDLLDPTVGAYDRVFHLGYRSWPTRSLPFETQACLQEQWTETAAAPAIDLQRPWIVPSYHLPPQDLVVGFTDEHFELKYGIYMLLVERFRHQQDDMVKIVNVSNSPRWNTETRSVPAFDWLGAAAWIAKSHVFLGCCSALHVLAVATGTPAIVMEPNRDRHNPIFWPLGTTDRVQLVTGLDQQPTFDARHVADAIEQAWARRATVNLTTV
jgi:hypothetical protein